MKQIESGKPSPKQKDRLSLGDIVRTYITAIRILHTDLGAFRIIAAYTFFVFAVLSLAFTIRLPVTSDFLPTTSMWIKTQSRVISGFMMIINILVYGIIMNWRRGKTVSAVVRVFIIGSAVYFDVFLVRIVYILILDGTFF